MKRKDSGNRQCMKWIFMPIWAITLILGYLAPAEAIPAFARKYQANCALCHTNMPRLTVFGQKFLANGYQFPGTSDGDTTAKKILDGEQGPVTLDEVSNIMALRIRGDISKAAFDVAPSLTADEVSVDLPTKVNLFFGGTATKDLSYFAEVETEDTLKLLRTFLQFSNLGGKRGVANLRVGEFDPSYLYSFPTHRQQLNPVGPELANDPPTVIGDVERVPLVPLAFAYKMYGLMGNINTELLLPFQPSLYNSPAQRGLSLHGRPFGEDSGLLYQIGVAYNIKVDGERHRDDYVMLRYDVDFGGVMAQVSAFNYKSPHLASLNGTGKTDLTRQGVAARFIWDAFDIYGAYSQDEIEVPAAMSAMWEDRASGMSMEGDWRIDSHWMLGMRYDQMSPGGMKAMLVDASWLGFIAKYYPSPNIGLYARLHNNLESSTALAAGAGGQHPSTNLRNMATLGVDMAF